MFVVVLDLKNKEVNATLRVNIQQQGADLTKSHETLDELFATSKRLQPSSQIYEGVDEKGRQVFYKNYQLQLLYKDKKCKFIELQEFQV